MNVVRRSCEEYGVSYIVVADGDRAAARVDDLQQMGAEQVYRAGDVVLLTAPTGD